MRKKMLIFLIVSILLACLIGFSNTYVLRNQDDGTTKNTATNEPSISTVNEQDVKVNCSTPPAEAEVKEDDNIPFITSEPFVGSMDLDCETEKFFYGTWKVEKLLGFGDSYNDASEYPTGQKVIDDEIIINKDFFSSEGLKNYDNYQYELKNPAYVIAEITYNSDSFYREFKTTLPGLNINDEVKYIQVYGPSAELGIPVSFMVINNDRCILTLESTDFELKKVTD